MWWSFLFSGGILQDLIGQLAISTLRYHIKGCLHISPNWGNIYIFVPYREKFIISILNLASIAQGSEPLSTKQSVRLYYLIWNSLHVWGFLWPWQQALCSNIHVSNETQTSINPNEGWACSLLSQTSNAHPWKGPISCSVARLLISCGVAYTSTPNVFFYSNM